MSTPFGTYLKTEVPNHLRVVAVVGGIAFSVWAFNYVRDLRAELKAAKQESATLAQAYKQYGGSAVSQNTTATQGTVNQQATAVFDPSLISTMKQQKDIIQNLTTILAGTKQRTDTVGATPVFTPVNHTDTGKLAGYTMAENRGTAPPLTSLSLFYDPSKSTPEAALNGTTWTHNQEQFVTSVGTWQQQKTGGYSTSVHLSRSVYKIDPTDPTKQELLGTEDIPITGSSTIYTPKGLETGTPVVMPRWTASLGVSKAPSGGYNPAALLDYRVTSRWGLFGGTANQSLIGGASIHF